MANSRKLNKQQELNKPQKQRKPINVKRLMIIIVFTIYMVTEIVAAVKSAKEVTGNISLAEVFELQNKGEIESVNVVWSEDIFYINLTNGETVTAVNPQNDTFIHDLLDAGINVTVQEETLFDSLTSVVVMLPMVLIMAMFVVYLTNTIIGGSTKMYTLLKPELNHITFDDVKGMGKTKEQVKFLVNQLKKWKELGSIGARPVKGALLYGPPGVGKTLLAKAIAKEAGVNFISASGSDFSEMFVGVGAARVRSLFELAAANVPCVIFIDEIDCMGKRRKGGDGASQDHNQTLNCLLQKMDGLNSFNGVMVIGATNRKEDLDDALLRPGRFDKHYFIGPPTCKKDRDELIKLYLDRKKLSDDVTLEKASKLMVGMTGAEVEEALNTAVYVSLQDNRDGIINLLDIDDAIMQTYTGGVKESYSSERDEEVVAVHEAGHALVSLLKGIPISKISIEPYTGGIGGVTMRDLDVLGDIKLKFEKDYENDIMITLAGKCAEEIVYGEHTQGCSNDIEKTTKLVYEMLSAFGYNDKSLLNQNVLIEKGIQYGIKDNLIKECNDKLNKYNNETMILLKEHRKELLLLKDLLLKNKIVVMPTLQSITEEQCSK